MFMYLSVYVQGSHKAIEIALFQVIRLVNEDCRFLVILLLYFMGSKISIFPYLHLQNQGASFDY